jgi:hypothetical protein
VVTAACFLFAGGPWVLARHPAFPAPSIFEGEMLAKLGRNGAARTEICVIASSVSDEAIQSLRVLDCFRRRLSSYGGHVASLAMTSAAA